MNSKLYTSEQKYAAIDWADKWFELSSK